MLDFDTPGWRVSLPVFEGPMDLLLYLVKKSEVDIYEIEIGKITDQYMAYLEALQEMDLEVAGEFLVVAATLIYIKSRTLLPVDQQPPEDDAEEEDPRWELIRQLIEYKKFKEAAFDLQKMELMQEKIFARSEPPAVGVQEIPGLGRVGVLDLVKAFQKILEKIQEKERVSEILEEKFTVGQKMEYVLDRIKQEGRVRFTQLFSAMSSRNEIVATFLALLELVRLKQLKCDQNSAFDDIDIYLAEDSSCNLSTS
jgi:segregation and condensation protein A